MSKKIIVETNVTLGCDPELFIRNGKNIIGSEKVVGKGLEAYPNIMYGKVVPDGVQVELNPESCTCREALNYCISGCLRAITQKLTNGMSLDFSQTVELTREEFSSLPESAMSFGCKPSFNVNSDEPFLMMLNPSKYLVRSAGGHIHIGAESLTTKRILKDVKRIVPVLDTILGNTCVLIDRNEGNKERRKYYGRAGEYRLPSYGIEYRTLSNFWLISPTISTFVMGLARHAVDICKNNLDKELMKLVDYKDVETAINNNDFGLALSNFNKIKEYLVGTVYTGSNSRHGYRYPLDENNIKLFEKLVSDGMSKYFSVDKAIDLWLNYSRFDHDGFYEWSLGKIKLQKKISKK